MYLILGVWLWLVESTGQRLQLRSYILRFSNFTSYICYFSIFFQIVLNLIKTRGGFHSRLYLIMILGVFRWNQLDLLIILLSIVGIVLEEMNAALPINPTIIRVMRVLRIARGGY